MKIHISKNDIKLPRFVCPKVMTSIKFKTKKDKVMNRQKMNYDVNHTLEI